MDAATAALDGAYIAPVSRARIAGPNPPSSFMGFDPSRARFKTARFRVRPQAAGLVQLRARRVRVPRSL